VADAVDEIDALVNPAPAAPEPPATTTVIDPAEVAPVQRRHLAVIDKDYAAALNAQDTLTDLLGGSVLDPILMDMRMAMVDFDIDRVRVSADAIATRLKINLEHSPL
jgi:hypothetical protein